MATNSNNPRSIRDQQNSLDGVIAIGTLTSTDQMRFRTHVEVARLFGRHYKGHQQATIRLDPSTHIWFPRLFKNADWDNSLAEDGRTLTMRPVEGGRYNDAMETKPARERVITFGKLKVPASEPSYKFIGVFEIDPLTSDGTQWVYRKISDALTFDGAGGYGFVASPMVPVNDDQNAETAEFDVNLISKFTNRIEKGTYAVDDKFASTKVRGSAQAAFAKKVKDDYDWRCAITGISSREFLVASHIVPWSLDPGIRLDPSNGICLSTFVDRAFDVGLLEIAPDSKVSVRWHRVADDSVLKSWLTPLDGIRLRDPHAFPPDPEKLARRITLGF